MYVYAHVFLNVCCSDCGIVCCVAVIVKYIFLNNNNNESDIQCT